MGCRQLKVLVKRYAGECHYCGDQTNRISGHPKQATKDHVVPKALGGTNTLDNYVLACHDCNNDKGTTLFYCMCFHCGPLIEQALANPELIQNVFDDMVQFNRAVVKKSEAGLWRCSRGYSHKSFETWAEAMACAEEPVKIRRNNG